MSWRSIVWTLAVATSLALAPWLAAAPAMAQEGEEPAAELPPATVDELPIEEVTAPVVADPTGVGESSALGGEAGAVAGRGAIVARVEVRSDAPLEDRDDLRELLAVVPGERLTERAVRQTLRNFQATGTAYEVELYTRPAAVAGEVDVVVALWAAIQVEEVAFEGELGLSRRELERRVDVAAGQPMIDSALLRGVFELYDLYRQRGYLDAVVRLDPEIDEGRKRARVVYRIDAGERAQIGAVRIVGDTDPFGEAALIRRFGVESGDAYRSEAVAEGVEELLEWLIGQDYRLAEVGEPEETVHDARDRVDLAIPLELGPRVEVEIIGGKMKRLERQGLLPFLEDSYDEALLLQAVQRIRTDYQERGHWRVDVDAREERLAGPAGEDVLRVVVEIDPRDVYTVDSLEFVGNELVSDDRLADLVETSPRRLLALGSGRLVDSVLDEDLANLRSFYALEGFVGFEVGPANLAVDGRSIGITIPIVEGRRRQVVEITWDGVLSLDLEELDEVLPLDEGGPFHPVLLEETLAILRGRYEALGFSSAQVSAELDWNPEETLVDVDIRAIEGPQVVADRIIVRGNVKTKDEVIEDAITLEPGEPVSRTRLLEVERDLYRLGIFSQVEVDLAPAELAEESRDVLVRVEEGRTRRATYGVSYDSDDGLGGLLGYSQGNLFGRAFTLQLDLLYGQKEELARVILDQPRVTRWDIPIIYSLAYQQLDREDPDYSVQRYVATVEAVRQIDEWRYGLALDYRRVELTLDQTVDPVFGEIERRDQNIQISSIIPNVLVDQRDDPLNPRRGWSGSLRLQYAFPIEGVTQADFLKPFFQATAYQDLGVGYLAGSFRLGGIEPFSDATPDLRPFAGGVEPPNLQVPIDERFFAGGNFSHRAYGRDELGVFGETIVRRDDGELVPRGGTGLLLVNLDYRVPVWGALEAVAFYDGGNVWVDWQDMDFSELRHGVGLALRYQTPIGPVRGGVAYRLEQYPGAEESDRWRFYLALGNPF